ncbi:MAG: thiamine pyrophosphate-binding protein [Victivallaceae bacterium]|nr:thiamine pyrophosphate-binding protein [Victivallaceae bacterium]
MQAAKYIFRQLAEWGVKDVFMVTGGGAMYLDAALGDEPRLRYFCCLHEQACAMAAEGHARITNRPGVVLVTSGPGGVNALTGVLGAWLDSVPMLVISGQVKRETMAGSYPGLRVRQLGDQEFDIVSAVRSMTKYAVCVTDAAKLKPELCRAWHAALSGRPGPVWLDVPLDIQNSEIDGALFDEPQKSLPYPSPAQLAAAETMLAVAAAPIIVAGRGIHCAGAEKEFARLIEKFNIPVLATPSGIDLLPGAHPLNYGRIGIMGNRAANIIMQNCDLMLVLGTRMSLRAVGYNWDDLAPNARRIMVDVDEAELDKPSFRVDLPICADAGSFIRSLTLEPPPRPDWLAYCERMRRKYPAEPDGHDRQTGYVDSYVFPRLLMHSLPSDSVVVCGNGTAYTSTFQSICLPAGTTLFANVGCASMGYALPAAIGACLAAPGRTVAALTGDGSIQMNLQELATVAGAKLPLKLFVYNNDGYLSIKSTQKAFNHGKYVGSNPASGVYLPALEQLAPAFGFRYFRIASHTAAETLLPEIMRCSGPVLCEVMLDPEEKLEPKAATAVTPDGRLVSRPLDDMTPLLDRAEYENNRWNKGR